MTSGREIPNVSSHLENITEYPFGEGRRVMLDEVVKMQREFGLSHPRGLVLLVDEDGDELDRYGVLLRALGCEVRTCASYEEGVRAVETNNYGLIIVSQGSHGFEGRRVLERAHEVDRGLQVLVVARYFDMPSYLEAIQLGAVDYLAGPLTEQELGRAVETHLRALPTLTAPILGIRGAARSARSGLQRSVTCLQSRESTAGINAGASSQRGAAYGAGRRPCTLGSDRGRTPHGD